MKCSVSHLDTGKLHPLCVQYPKQTNPQPAYVEFDTRTGDLTADWSGEIGNAVPVDVWEGKRLRWGISCELTEVEINDLLIEIGRKITWDAEEEEWSIPDDEIEGLADSASDDSTASSEGGAWEAGEWFVDLSWNNATATIPGAHKEWSIIATTSDTDLDKIAKSMQDDANGEGVTLIDIDSFLKELREDAYWKSEKATDEWFYKEVSWDNATATLNGDQKKWSITATTSDADLDTIAKSMQDDANRKGFTFVLIDYHLDNLRDEAIEKSKED